MDDEYSDIFRSLYTGAGRYPFGPLPYGPFDGQAQYIVRNAIEAASQELASEVGGLRPDAKLFLMLNFLGMIAVPALARGYEQYVDGALTEDINRVVRTATTLQSNADRNGVSAHAILNSVSANWDSLNLRRMLRWGGEQQFDQPPPSPGQRP